MAREQAEGQNESGSMRKVAAKPYSPRESNSWWTRGAACRSTAQEGTENCMSSREKLDHLSQGSKQIHGKKSNKLESTMREERGQSSALLPNQNGSRLF